MIFEAFKNGKNKEVFLMNYKIVKNRRSRLLLWHCQHFDRVGFGRPDHGRVHVHLQAPRLATLWRLRN